MSGEYLRESYPLTWPERQPRTVKRRPSTKFKASFAQSRDELLRELKLLGALDIVISTNVPTRRDGLPLADAREPTDPGVAVYFDRMVKEKRHPFTLACDSYDKVRFNLRAVGLTVEALRSIARHGATEMLEQAFTGFAALPAAGGGEPWWEVLGVPQQAHPDVIRAKFRSLSQVHHPDKGGSQEMMSKLTQAYHAALGGAA